MTDREGINARFIFFLGKKIERETTQQSMKILSSCRAELVSSGQALAPKWADLSVLAMQKPSFVGHHSPYRVREVATLAP